MNDLLVRPTHIARPPISAAAETPVATKPVSPRKTILGRFGGLLRRTVGLTLVAAAGWWILLPAFYPVTSEAVVNARTVQVRAPIDGSADRLLFDVRDRVEEGAVMARFANRHLDTSGLTGLSTRRAELLTRRERLAKELDEVTRVEAESRTAASKYRDALVSSLEAGRKETASKLEAVKIEEAAAAKRLERIESLPARSLSGSELDVAKEGLAVCRAHLQTQQATLSRVDQEIRAARDGLFLQKESPHFQQRADEMAHKAPQIRAGLKEADDLLRAVEEQIVRETGRTDRMTESSATAPAGGVVWTRQGNANQGVKQNEVVYEIADGSSVFVEAVVHQRHLGSAAPGTPALINVTGGPTLAGKVRSVRPCKAGDNEPTFAFGVTEPDAKKLRVMVELESGVADPAALIGRHVRVLLIDPESSSVNRGVSWVFSNLRL